MDRHVATRSAGPQRVPTHGPPTGGRAEPAGSAVPELLLGNDLRPRRRRAAGERQVGESRLFARGQPWMPAEQNVWPKLNTS